MTTHSFSALYYPLIHFRNEEWLKLSALYWDRMGRIVPHSYEPEDPPAVAHFGDYVETLRPEWVRPEFGAGFVEFIKDNAPGLRARYDVRGRGGWDPVPGWRRPPFAGGPSGTDPRLGYVYFEKMTPELRRVLLDSSLATFDEAGPDGGGTSWGPRWIGMHPLLADVYMTALAEQLARERLMHPLTDRTTGHLAVGSGGFERVAQAVLSDSGDSGALAPSAVEDVAACVALQCVLPKGLHSVPVERILEFREKYPEERGRFQQHVQEFVAVRTWLAEARDRKTLEERLGDEFGRTLKPQLAELREKLRDCNIDSVMGVLSMKVEMPGAAIAAAGLLGVVAAPVGLVAGAALAVIPVLRGAKKAQKELRRTPVAFLLNAEEELKPADVVASIDRRARGMRLGGSPAT